MIVLVLLYVAAVVSAKKVTPYNLSAGPQYFEDFIDTHNKVYSSDEEKAMRYQVFLDNLEEINQLNAKYEHTGFSVNQFTDLTLQEFQARHKPLKVPADYYSCTTANLEAKNKYEHLKMAIYNNVSYDNFDWRDKNVVTRVKNQGPCEASWAFSAVGNVESIYALRSGELRELSEQQLVDCDTSNYGCQKGDPVSAIEYVVKNGLMFTEAYPYEAEVQHCRYQQKLVGVVITGCKWLDGEERTMHVQLVTNGPFSMVLDTTSLRHYASGVLTGDNCQYSQVNQGVLLVGYGVDRDSGLPYWLFKNSWGESFGEGGYFRMHRGVNCLGFNVMPPVTAVMA